MSQQNISLLALPVVLTGTVTANRFVTPAGAAVAAGATLKADASGRGIAWATSGAKVGLALQAASGAGAFIEVLLIPNVA